MHGVLRELTSSELDAVAGGAFNMNILTIVAGNGNNNGNANGNLDGNGGFPNLVSGNLNGSINGSGNGLSEVFVV